MTKESKYEFMLHTWGGFYNPEYSRVHGKKEGYFFFNTLQELDAYILELKKIEENMKAYHLVTKISSGKHVRCKTIAQMRFVYKGKSYYYEEDFGYAYPVEAAEYMFEEGNYSCDCNRSNFIRNRYGDVIEEMDCGNNIEMKDFEVLQIETP